MTTALINLSDIGLGVLCTISFLLLCAGLTSTLLAAIYRTPAVDKLLCVVPVSVHLILLCMLLEGMTPGFSLEQSSPAMHALWNASLWCLTLLLVLTAIWVFHALRRLGAWQRSHLSGTSVKEALDQLPSGLCFYVQDGLPRLVNLRMCELCDALTGKPLTNGESFWQSLANGDVRPGVQVIQTGPDPILQTIDGQVWSFARRRIHTSSAQAVEIIASEITQEHEMNTRLAMENQQLAAMNRRLREYGSHVRELTREKETLAAKMRIHDEFGQALLASRRLLAAPGDTQRREDVLRQWRHNLTMLESIGDAPQPARGLSGLIAAARAVGVQLSIDGAMPPEDAPLMALLENAAHECLTNTVRHAGGTHLHVRLTYTPGRMTAVFTNDGAIPKGKVTEGGGLSALRQQVETAGGSMDVQSAPYFALTVNVPTESEESW